MNRKLNLRLQEEIDRMHAKAFGEDTRYVSKIEIEGAANTGKTFALFLSLSLSLLNDKTDGKYSLILTEISTELTLKYIQRVIRSVLKIAISNINRSVDEFDIPSYIEDRLEKLNVYQLNDLTFNHVRNHFKGHRVFIDGADIFIDSKTMIGVNQVVSTHHTVANRRDFVPPMSKLILETLTVDINPLNNESKRSMLVRPLDSGHIPYKYGALYDISEFFDDDED